MTNTIVFDEEQLVFKILIEQSTGEMMTNEVTAKYSDIDLDSVDGDSSGIDIRSRARKKSFTRFVQYDGAERTGSESKFEIPIFIGEREATYEEVEAVVEKLKQYLSLRGVKPFTIAPEEGY